MDLLLALGASVAKSEVLLVDISRAAVELVLLVAVGNDGLDLDVKSPAAVVLNGANLVVRSAIGQREVRNMALDLLIVVLGLAVVALLAVLEGILSRRLTTLDVDDDVLILVVVDMLEVEDDAVVLEIKGHLAQSLMRGTMRGVDAEIPGIAGLVVVLGKDKGRWVRNPLVFAMLSTAVKSVVLSFAGVKFEVGK